MGPLIGVADEASLTRLKRWILLVDRIAVVRDPDQDWSLRGENPSLAADLDWLSEREVVFRVYKHLNATVNVKSVRNNHGSIILESDAKPATINIVAAKAPGAKSITVRQLRDALDDITCRMECEELRTTQGANAVSLKSPSPNVVFPDLNMRLGDVHRVTIEAMPEPDDGASLDQILAFRSDSEAVGKMLALRRWMSGVAKSSSTPHEIAQELEWLLHEYEEHLKVHRLKVNKGVLETIITGVAEVAEDLVKIKWGKLAKIPFSISARKIELLEAELKAPGREIAYVSRAKSEFSGK